MIMIPKKLDRRGITIVELLTVVVIIGVMAALAVPNFDSTIISIKHKSTVRDILGKMRMARSYAISRGTRWGVYVGPPSRLNPSDRLYYISFQDVNSSGSYDGGDVMQDSTLLDINLSLDSSTFASSAVVFKNDGCAVAGGHVDIVNDNNSARTRINVTAAVGRVSLSTPQ